MHVTLVGGYYRDPSSAGGIRAYVESLGRYLDNVGISHLKILTGPEFQVGRDWCTIPVARRGSSAQMLASLCVNLRSIPIPQDSVVHAQRPDDFLPFWLAGLGSRWVCTLHGDPMAGVREGKNRAVSSVYAALEAVLLRRADKVIFVDDFTPAHYLTRYPWLRRMSSVIPNAVDTAVFFPIDRAEVRLKWGFVGPTFLYAGRLDREKRVPAIVRTFRSLGSPDATLVIAGDGRERDLVFEAARGARVRMLGPIPREAMPSLINAADAVVLYSTREGLPSIVLEALACGIPVVAPPVGAIPEVVRDGVNGFLVKTEEELREAMREVGEFRLARTGDIPKSIARYSWLEVGPKVVDLYRSA